MPTPRRFQHLQRLRSLTGAAALGAGVLSALIAVTVRDAAAPAAVIFFGTPWLARLGLLGAAWLLLRPMVRAAWIPTLLAAAFSLSEGLASIRWRDPAPPSPGSFEVVLWNTGRNLHRMPREWPRLAGPDCKIMVFIEAGAFPGDTWSRFTAVHPDFTWQQLAGGIVVGVRGKILGHADFGTDPRFRCHRLRVEVDGEPYTLLAVDIPSQPWIPRQPFLDVVRAQAPAGRCLILGDFNTPPEARGFDAWRSGFALANDSRSTGFRETWCYGLPLLTLDQLWLSRDLAATGAAPVTTLRSDHRRMVFRVRPAR